MVHDWLHSKGYMIIREKKEISQYLCGAQAFIWNNDTPGIMSPAIGAGKAFELLLQQMVLLQAVSHEHAFIAAVVFKRISVMPCPLVFIEHYRRLLIKFSRSMHPHEILVAGRSFSVIRIIRIIIVDDLYRCFIGLVDVPLQEFLPEPFNKWLKVLLRAPDDPVSHGLSGNVDTVPIELVLYAV